MPSTVKLTTAEYRAWRVNKAQWVSAEGYVLRAVTPEEERSLFPAVERTKQVGKTQAYNLTVTYKHEDPDTGREVESKTQMEAIVRITPTGRERHNYLADVFVNGCRYVKGREIIEKRMLATHGECLLHGPNGKRLRIVRNPNVRRPTYNESQRVAPHPDNCHCRGWKDKSEPGRHHAACNWNDKAPPHERALPFQAVAEPTMIDNPEPLESLAFDPQSVRAIPAPVERPRGRIVPPPPGAARRPQAGAGPNMDAPVYANVPPSLPSGQSIQRTRVPPVAPLPEVHPPSACPEDCRGVKSPEKAWRWPAGRKPEKGQHHPLCPHDGAYRQKVRGDKRWMIYDLERRVEVRDATTEEVTQSELELARSGTRSVSIAGRIYAVVQAGQSEPRAARRSTAGASVRRMEQSNAARRQQVIDRGDLPAVPRPMRTDNEEMSDLRARLAELEQRAQAQLRVGPGSIPLPPDSLQPIPMPTRAAPITHAADHLRDGLGLVGHQQATDDIPTGPVQLDEPEPFVDPLMARAEAAVAARRPVDYHPGAVRPKSFVPPLPPGLTTPPVDAVFAGGVAIETDAVDSTDAEPEAVDVGVDGAEAVDEEEVDAEVDDEEVARLVAEAEAAEAELARLEAEPDEGGDDEEVDDGPDGDGEPIAANGYDQLAAG